MDVTMPLLDGVEATSSDHHVPGCQVVMLTMHADSSVMQRAIQAGAVGYLVKDCSERRRGRRRCAWPLTATPCLGRARLVHVGRGPAQRRRGTGGDQQPGGGGAPAGGRRPLAARGGRRLFISVKTVKNHLASIYQKLDARDRTQAVLRAVRMGIIHLD